MHVQLNYLVYMYVAVRCNDVVGAGVVSFMIGFAVAAVLSFILVFICKKYRSKLSHWKDVIIAKFRRGRAGGTGEEDTTAAERGGVYDEVDETVSSVHQVSGEERKPEIPVVKPKKPRKIKLQGNQAYGTSLAGIS